jgi:hypothetical protein
MAAYSKAWVGGRSLAGIAGSNPAGGIDTFLLRLLFGVQVSVSATGRFLFKGSLPSVCVCVSLSVVRRKSNLLHVQ